MDMDRFKNRTEEELRIRERLIDRIEAMTGSLTSVPYHTIDTADLQKLEEALYHDR